MDDLDIRRVAWIYQQTDARNRCQWVCYPLGSILTENKRVSTAALPTPNPQSRLDLEVVDSATHENGSNTHPSVLSLHLRNVPDSEDLDIECFRNSESQATELIPDTFYHDYFAALPETTAKLHQEWTMSTILQRVRRHGELVQVPPADGGNNKADGMFFYCNLDREFSKRPPTIMGYSKVDKALELHCGSRAAGFAYLGVASESLKTFTYVTVYGRALQGNFAEWVKAQSSPGNPFTNDWMCLNWKA
ncbi:hypothetical protein BJ508DRAFT_307943 [Ascobolus immersus RN42]|uniref:Uncharacterized protein n=1 Tax=Ascobolus immersus RN42 TaxID=1160509 RepID=A0A3N4I6V0_ASCIM|nr:hypothetical protein BJ508DRAFT_307943 [Ascobolus immersus RN42]